MESEKLTGWQPIETLAMWDVAIVTDGENVAKAQKAEADYSGHYFAVDPEDCLEWEPTMWIACPGDEAPTRAPADLRSALEAETIERIAQVAEAVGMQAGVGGMETAGAIVSYLANHPDLIKPFVAGKISTIDFSPRWLVEGRLTWLGRDDKIHDAGDVALGDVS